MVRLAHMTTVSTSSLNPFAVNTSAKDAFARLLATENLTVVHDASAPTAMFDTMSRVLTLPVWKDMTGDIYDMLCAHEVGHALHTPRDMAVIAASMTAIDADASANQQVLHDYLNVVEDIRIDRLMKDLYPGLKRCYAEAGKYLYNKNFFGVTDLSPADVAALSMLDRVNLHFKSGIYGVTSVPMSVDEAAWLPRLESLKTWDDVVTLATELYEYDGAKKSAKQQQQQQPPQAGNDAGDGEGEDAGAAVASEQGSEGNDAGQSEATGQSSDSEDSSAADGSNSSGPEATTQDGNKQSNGDGKQQDKNAPAKQSKPAPASNGGGTNSKPTGSVTAEAERKNASSLIAADGTTVRKWKMPTVNLAEVVVGYKSVCAQFAGHLSRNPNYTGAKLLNDFRKNSTDAIKMLVKQFEMKMAADESRRTRSARCGVIDMDRVSDYRFSDDIFLSIEEHAKGKNHGMIIFVDWSGSMSSNLKNTVYQLMNLVMFCKAVGIPFEVYLFTDAYDVYCEKYNLTGNGSANYVTTHVNVCKEYAEEIEPRTGHKSTNYGEYLTFRRFHLLNVLSNKMTKTQFDLCAGMMLAFGDCSASSYHPQNPTPPGFGLGGTPLDEAVYAAVPLTQQFKADYKLQVANVVFLTDGESGSSPFHTSDKFGNNNCRPVLVDGNKSWAVPVKVSGSRYTYVEQKMTTTAVFRSYLKYKTGANVIGFFLTESMNSAKHYIPASAEADSQFASLKENGFASVQTEGFDQNFIIVPTATTSSDDVKNALNKAARDSKDLRNAFMKSSKSIRGSRVLMSRIADVIAKNLS